MLIGLIEILAWGLFPLWKQEETIGFIEVHFKRILSLLVWILVGLSNSLCAQLLFGRLGFFVSEYSALYAVADFRFISVNFLS